MSLSPTHCSAASSPMNTFTVTSIVWKSKWLMPEFCVNASSTPTRAGDVVTARGVGGAVLGGPVAREPGLVSPRWCSRRPLRGCGGG
jgi:hypothetical protein